MKFYNLRFLRATRGFKATQYLRDENLEFRQQINGILVGDLFLGFVKGYSKVNDSNDGKSDE